MISETALRGLVLSAAEAIAPVCAALVVRTLPDWMNLRRMFEEAKAGGDWLADEFLKGIHALCELEDHARIRAERLGGAPEVLYRERRAVRLESARSRRKSLNGAGDASSSESAVAACRSAPSRR